MDNSADAIVRDTKIIAVSVVALLGGGTLLLLFVAEYPRLAFLSTILLGLFALLVLLSSR